MKQLIFNQYVEKISDTFNVTKEEMFEKNKKRNVVESRYMLYYMCFNRPMKIERIKEYMASGGYMISHRTIIYGIDQIQERSKFDIDYMDVVKELTKEFKLCSMV